MYILYGGPFTRALIIQMVLSEGDLEYELRNIDVVGQEHRETAFLEINPSGLIPALITPEGETLYETPAIGLYLADRHNLESIAPRVDDPQRGKFLSGLFYLTDEVEPALKRYFYPHRYALRETDEVETGEQALVEATRKLRIVEHRLSSNGPYFLGERISLIDFALAYWGDFLITTNSYENCPGLKRCLNLVMNRPKTRPHFEQMAQWRREYAALQAKGAGAR